MNRTTQALLLGLGAAALVAYPHDAYPLSVHAYQVVVTDAQPGSTSKLLVGRKLQIACKNKYESIKPWFEQHGPLPQWKIRLEVDGKIIGEPAAIPCRSPWG
jgi:hypothetical protein